MRRLKRHTGIFLALPFAVALLAAPSLAQNKPEQRLKSLEQKLEEGRKEQQRLQLEAATLTGDLSRVRKDLVKGARAIQEYESSLTNLETRLSSLEQQRKELRAKLRLRDKQTVRVLTALQRLAWRPSEALIAQPLPPTDAVRSAILLRAAVPQIRASVQVINEQITQLSLLRGEIGAQRDRISVVAREMAGQQISLERLFNQKSIFQKRTENESRAITAKVNKLASEASDLRDLLLKVTEQRRKMKLNRKNELARKAAAMTGVKPKLGPSGKVAKTGKATEKRPRVEHASITGFSAIKGRLPFPARGKVTIRYGERNDVGLNSKGIHIKTRAAAQVISPYDGVVVFAGPFRRYGQLLIIEHGEGYHVLLAGMARVDATVGQQLLGGEPVGVMEAGKKPDLYVELRRNGRPINPLPWLIASKG